MITLCLVGCSGMKRSSPAPAQDLYCSPLFRLGRAWAERHANVWGVLSARFGVVRPTEVIKPYNTTIADRTPFGMQRLSPKDFDTWLYANVQAWLSRGVTVGEPYRLVVLAGQAYSRPLLDRGLNLETPLAGLPIGRRLHWLKERA